MAAGRHVAAGRREHADAAARPQSSCPRPSASDRRHQPRTEDQRSDRRRSRSRSATPSARSSRSTRTRFSSATAPTASRRPSRLYFAKIGQRRHARRSRAARRHHPVTGAAEPVRQHGRRHAAAQLRAAAHGRRRLHLAGEQADDRQDEADRRPRAAAAAADRSRPYFLEEVRKHLEAALRRESAVRERAVGEDDARCQACRTPPTARSSAGLRRLDKRRGYRRPTRNVLAEKQTLEGFKDERWTRPIAAGDVVPAVVTAVGTRARGRRHRGPHRTLPRRL